MAQEQSTFVGHVLGGRYRITRRIGEGAMASVYEAADQQTEGESVAIKVMHPHLAADPTFSKRFRREAKAASRLDHPNTVRVFHYAVEDGTAYMAMELLRGRDLADILDAERTLTSAWAAAIVAEVASALSAAHELGIVHRDLKPGNVMLLDTTQGDEPRVKVLDFGIAKMAKLNPFEKEDTASSASALTSAGTAVGTPEYMSPEQCRGTDVDHRTDIYACGVMLYELTTGQQPFTGEVHVDIMLKHVREPPKPPREVNPDVDEELESIILTALNKSADLRQGTAHELEIALRNVAARLRASTRVSVPPASTPRDGPPVDQYAATLAAAPVPENLPPPPRPSLPSYSPADMTIPPHAPMPGGSPSSHLAFATVAVVLLVVVAGVAAIAVLFMI